MITHTIRKFFPTHLIKLVLATCCLQACEPTGINAASAKNPPCGEPTSLISSIQGEGSASPLAGSQVSIEGIVIGDYQETGRTNPTRPELSGFYVQEEDTDSDGNQATSEGLFVYDPEKMTEVEEGDQVRVTGTVSEHSGNTQLERISLLKVCAKNLFVTAANIQLPVPVSFEQPDDYWEQFEGMLLSFSEPMTVTNSHGLARYGELSLSQGGRLKAYSQVGDHPLSQAGRDLFRTDHERRRIKLDDYNNQENSDPVFHPQPGGFAVDNTVRVGAAVNNLQAVLEYRFDAWRLHPQKTAIVAFENEPRPEAPVMQGNLVIAVLNVLNYFNGDGQGNGFGAGRGAASKAEFERQRAKIIAAIRSMNPDVLGLVEIQNDGDSDNSALADLVHAINQAEGADGYDYIRAGKTGGTDQVKVALIYRPAVVTPLGAAKVLSTKAFTDPNQMGRQRNRPALAQSFQITGTENSDLGEAFTLVVLHLKSQGGDCGEGDDDPVHGDCNQTRTRAVKPLLEWLSGDPTDTGGLLGMQDPDVLIMGDINSYFQQQPLQLFYQAGYTNLLPQEDHTYVYEGKSGSLDHALASKSFAEQIVRASTWNINSDESELLDYKDTVADSAEEAWQVKPAKNPLYAPNAFRSSDHDPLIIGLDLFSERQPDK